MGPHKPGETAAYAWARHKSYAAVTHPAHSSDGAPSLPPVSPQREPRPGGWGGTGTLASSFCHPQQLGVQASGQNSGACPGCRTPASLEISAVGGQQCWATLAKVLWDSGSRGTASKQRPHFLHAAWSQGQAGHRAPGGLPSRARLGTVQLRGCHPGPGWALCTWGAAIMGQAGHCAFGSCHPRQDQRVCGKRCQPLKP